MAHLCALGQPIFRLCKMGLISQPPPQSDIVENHSKPDTFYKLRIPKSLFEWLDTIMGPIVPHHDFIRCTDSLTIIKLFFKTLSPSMTRAPMIIPCQNGYLGVKSLQRIEPCYFFLHAQSPYGRKSIEFSY